jgi:hypothetical protein
MENDKKDGLYKITKEVMQKAGKGCLADNCWCTLACVPFSNTAEDGRRE